MFNYFIQNNFWVSNWLYSRLFVCCSTPINYAWNDISFDFNPLYNIRMAVLDISKALDKVWHKVLMLDAWRWRTASYQITLVRPYVCPSLNFLKIGSLGFFDIVHDDSWLWYLVADEARFFFKKNWQSEFGPKGPKSGPKLGFLSFSEVWFISFPCNCIQW